MGQLFSTCIRLEGISSDNTVIVCVLRSSSAHAWIFSCSHQFSRAIWSWEEQREPTRDIDGLIAAKMTMVLTCRREIKVYTSSSSSTTNFTQGQPWTRTLHYPRSSMCDVRFNSKVARNKWYLLIHPRFLVMVIAMK